MLCDTAEDREGQQADFHALRHTFLSRLGRSGASATVMQRLARHSTVGLTLDRYTHAGLFDLQTAVEKLPPLPSTGPKPVAPETTRPKSRFCVFWCADATEGRLRRE